MNNKTRNIFFLFNNFQLVFIFPFPFDISRKPSRQPPHPSSSTFRVLFSIFPLHFSSFLSFLPLLIRPRVASPPFSYEKWDRLRFHRWTLEETRVVTLDRQRLFSSGKLMVPLTSRVKKYDRSSYTSISSMRPRNFVGDSHHAFSFPPSNSTSWLGASFLLFQTPRDRSFVSCYAKPRFRRPVPWTSNL